MNVVEIIDSYFLIIVVFLKNKDRFTKRIERKDCFDYTLEEILSIVKSILRLMSCCLMFVGFYTQHPQHSWCSTKTGELKKPFT